MMARIDEHNSNSHLKMSFLEFLEAISRAAEFLSLGPPSDHVREAYKEFLADAESQMKELNNSRNPETLRAKDILDEDELLENEEGAFMSHEEHINQPLYKKIEHLIPFILAFCTSLNFKKKWKWPRKNPHTGLYTDVKEAGVKEVKSMMVKGIKNLIISRFNLKEIVKKKGLSIKLKGMTTPSINNS